ncbi:hypothetical protein L3X38_040472 [Prunus dulcis]|uniref:GH18 domain-containing protein n=1 Tax=Prunus dulcis TaxID=3755 RepID=A0AAD4VAA5_PRUDU|nr:hypothetical protein L3X38_040472 [Prunus dulcis]
MASLNDLVHILLLSCSLMIFNTGCMADSLSDPHPPVKSAYYPSWLSDDFPPSAINTSFFTHIFYAFLVPNDVTFKFDLSNSTALLLSNFTTTLHHKHPPVKTLLSLGGGGDDPKLPKIFARMASEPSSRSHFIHSAIEVARKFGFDGLDLDWEFPKSPKEMKDLGHLLKEWRHALKKEAKSTARPPLLLTAAVYFSANFFLANVRRSYPMPHMNKYLDWINAMCFDYNGAWSNTTGPNAALLDPKSNVNSIYGLRSWIKAGIPPKKLVMGLPLYGRTWELKDPNNHSIGATAVGPGPGGGQLLFHQVETLLNQSGATIVYDVDTMTVYSLNGSSWVSFDDAFTATSKIGYAQALGLRGYFFWALTYDSDWKISAQASNSWILDK